MNNTPEVEFSKDDGFKNQWGIGRLFYTVEGGKKRINSKTVLCVVSFCFAVAAVIGLLKDTGPVGADEPSPISVSSNLASSEQMVVPEYSPSSESAEIVSSNANRSKPAKDLGLELVKRNPKLEIPPGSMVKAVLMTGGSNGYVRAVLTEPVQVNGEVLLKANTVLLGAGQSTKERLNISFTQAVFKDGSFQSIQAQACDPLDKMPGISGENVRGQAVSLAGAIGLNFAGGMAMGLQQKAGTQQAVQPTLKDALLNGAALAALERAKELSQDMKATQPLIEVESGTEVYVLFLGQQ